ncbi:CpaD family pilus assembly protein [Rhizobium sp. PAMB 3182]
MTRNSRITRQDAEAATMVHKPTAYRFSRLFVASSMMAIAGFVTSCGSMGDRIQTGSIPDDYRTRHPIVLADVPHTLNLAVGTGDKALPIGSRDVLKGFAANFIASGGGTIQVALPQGAINSATASHLSKEIRRQLVTAGVSAPQIVTTVYDAGSYEGAAPIHLSYSAVTAVTNTCGQWPKDLMADSMANKNWYNFGCASQNNLAAQIANPMDLVAPRGMTPIDADRRSTVIDNYRDGSSTASE